MAADTTRRRAGIRRVLVVDDDPDLRLLTRRWLGPLDRFQVVGEAETGRDAIEASRRLRPDIVIMDVCLPDGDGEEATRIIGSLAPRTKVLAHSASADRSFVLAMIGAGVNGYLVKSGHHDEFVEALDAVASGGVYLSDNLRAHVLDHVRAFLDQTIGQTPTSTLPVRRDHRIIDLALRPRGLQIALQPIVDLASHTTVGFEALSRFDHVDSPCEIFDAADRVDRHAEVELAAARRAVEVARSLAPAEGFVSVNASPDVLMTTDFASVLDLVDPSAIVIELTEQLAVSDYASLNGALDRLRARGFRLAVDDVGGGFACLTHVHQLRPDIIKIDRYLIDGIESDRTRQSMVSALVAIADGIGALLVGEGIERSEELCCLRDLGVQLGQGFFLGRPVVDSPAVGVADRAAVGVSAGFAAP